LPSILSSSTQTSNTKEKNYYRKTRASILSSSTQTIFTPPLWGGDFFIFTSILSSSTQTRLFLKHN